MMGIGKGYKLKIVLVGLVFALRVPIGGDYRSMAESIGKSKGFFPKEFKFNRFLLPEEALSYIDEGFKEELVVYPETTMKEKDKIRDLINKGKLSVAEGADGSKIISGFSPERNEQGNLQSLSQRLNFLLGRRKDQFGNFIHNFWNFDYHVLEKHKVYIQFLFPTDEYPENLMDAIIELAQIMTIDVILEKDTNKAGLIPILTKEDIQVFHGTTKITRQLRTNMLRSFGLMLDFYGFQYAVHDGKVTIERSANFTEQSENWLDVDKDNHNHNFKRITRILDSLRLTGLEDHALAFFNALNELQEDFPCIENSLNEHWKISVENIKTKEMTSTDFLNIRQYILSGKIPASKELKDVIANESLRDYQDSMQNLSKEKDFIMDIDSFADNLTGLLYFYNEETSIGKEIRSILGVLKKFEYSTNLDKLNTLKTISFYKMDEELQGEKLKTMLDDALKGAESVNEFELFTGLLFKLSESGKSYNFREDKADYPYVELARLESKDFEEFKKRCEIAIDNIINEEADTLKPDKDIAYFVKIKTLVRKKFDFSDFSVYNDEQGEAIMAYRILAKKVINNNEIEKAAYSYVIDQVLYSLRRRETAGIRWFLKNCTLNLYIKGAKELFEFDKNRAGEVENRKIILAELSKKIAIKVQKKIKPYYNKDTYRYHGKAKEIKLRDLILDVLADGYDRVCYAFGKMEGVDVVVRISVGYASFYKLRAKIEIINSEEEDDVLMVKNLSFNITRKVRSKYLDNVVLLNGSLIVDKLRRGDICRIFSGIKKLNYNSITGGRKHIVLIAARDEETIKKLEALKKSTASEKSSFVFGNGFYILPLLNKKAKGEFYRVIWSSEKNESPKRIGGYGLGIKFSRGSNIPRKFTALIRAIKDVLKEVRTVQINKRNSDL
ncbi:opioid growth factor receptor-related protein [Candidatus Omnitrophota bacterium]